MADAIELQEYDAGLINDFGGGNVGWWQDYIRAELERAYCHYQEQADGIAADNAKEIERLRTELKAAHSENNEQAYGLLNAKLTAAKAECEVMRVDADRYRWLREECKKHNSLTICRVGEWDLEPWSGDDPDNAIDSAINAAKAGGE